MATVIRLSGRNGEVEKVITTVSSFRVLERDKQTTPALRATFLGTFEANANLFAVSDVTYGAHIEDFLPRRNTTLISGWIENSSQYITLRVKDPRQPIIYRGRRYLEATLFERKKK